MCITKITQKWLNLVQTFNVDGLSAHLKPVRFACHCPGKGLQEIKFCIPYCWSWWQNLTFDWSFTRLTALVVTPISVIINSNIGQGSIPELEGMMYPVYQKRPCCFYICVIFGFCWPIFIACQHAMHAEHDIVLPILSVCLSNSCTVSKQMDI